MSRRYRIRLMITLLVILAGLAVPASQQLGTMGVASNSKPDDASLAKLAKLEVKGRAPKTGYSREQFGNGWANVGSCDVRNIILARDLAEEVVDTNCKVLSGMLNDPYTGTDMNFRRGTDTSDDVQIDHVVALSNAWQTGAQYTSFAVREAFANDSLNLLAVNGNENQAKGDGDAATWLPPNKPFRCQYVARQIDVKTKYKLWVTLPEKQAMERVLASC